MRPPPDGAFTTSSLFSACLPAVNLYISPITCVSIPYFSASISAQRESRLVHSARVREEEERRLANLQRLKEERAQEEALLNQEFAAGQRIQEAQVRYRRLYGCGTCS